MTDWYYSMDAEFWYIAKDKEDAIKMCVEYGSETIFKTHYICEAVAKEFPYSSLFDIDYIDESCIEDNEDVWGPDQDSIFSSPPTFEQKTKLNKMLEETFRRWVDEENIKLETPWCLDFLTDPEEIIRENYCWVWTKYRREL